MSVDLGDLAFSISADTTDLEQARAQLRLFAEQVGSTITATDNFAKETEAAFSRQERAIRSANLSLAQLKSTMSTAGASANLIEQANTAYLQFVNTMKSGVLGTLDFQRAQDRLRLTLAGIKDELKQVQASTQTAAGGAGIFTTAMHGLTAAAAMGFGPLSGIGSRLIAFNYLVTQVGPGAAGAVAAILALAAAAYEVAKATISASIEMERINAKLYTATNSAAQTAVEFRFVSDVADKLGINLRGAAEGYSKFLAAASSAGLSGEESRRIFTGIMTASAAMRLTQEQTNSVFLVFEQILNKDRVQSEEMVKQLGNALPGAFRTAAEALGVTNAQLTKLMKQGELDAKDTAIRIGDQLAKSYGGAAQEAQRGIIAETNRFNNALLEEWNALNKVTGASDKWASVLRTLSGAIKWEIENIVDPSKFGTRELDDMMLKIKAFNDPNNKLRTPISPEQKQEWFITLEQLRKSTADFYEKIRTAEGIAAGGGGGQKSLKEWSDRLKEIDAAIVGLAKAQDPLADSTKSLTAGQQKAVDTVQLLIDKMHDLQNVYHLLTTGKINYVDVSGYEKALEVLRKMSAAQQKAVYDTLNPSLPSNMQGGNATEMLINIERAAYQAKKGIDEYSEAQKRMPDVIQWMNSHITQWKRLESAETQGREALRDWRFELAQSKEWEEIVAKIKSVSGVISGDLVQSWENALRAKQAFDRDVRSGDAYQQILQHIKELQLYNDALSGSPSSIEASNREIQYQRDEAALTKFHEVLSRVILDEQTRNTVLSQYRQLQLSIAQQTTYVAKLWRDAEAQLATGAMGVIADQLTESIVRGQTFEQTLRNISAEITAMAVRMVIFNSLMSAFGPFGGASSPPSGYSPAPRAAGGSVSAGAPYIVGEKGAEMFIPSVPGSIIDANTTKGLSGGDSYHIHIDARGADAGVEGRVMNVISQMHQKTVQAAVATIRSQRKRGYKGI